MSRRIPVIIPAYEPDERLIRLLETMNLESKFIIIVDDGSGEKYSKIFEEAKRLLTGHGEVLHHEVNYGKGRALRTGFSYVLSNIPEAIGVVTADSDGQHTIGAINKVSEALVAEPEKLIMGCRKFDSENIPWRSSFGNKVTIKTLAFVTGIKVSDTQTGLRGIPRSFMLELMDIKYDRFEFEMEMLVKSVKKYPIVEVPIETIYDSKENHQTHFRPVADSAKIYKVIAKRFIGFLISSVSSFVIDIALFSLFCMLLKSEDVGYVAISTVLARIISATYNYLVNYVFVFKSNEKMSKAAFKYFVLAVFMMAASAGITTGYVAFLKVNETAVKIVVDTLLFFSSYVIQRKLIFKRK